MTKAAHIMEKLAKTKQTREEELFQGKTTYHKGDDSPEKKKIVDQIANQITVNKSKTKNIKSDWKNSTVSADTTFTPYGGIGKVRHKVKRDGFFFPLEAQSVRSTHDGLTNIYGEDVREDPNPPVKNLFPPEGLSKKKMIKKLNMKKTGELVMEAFNDELIKEAGKLKVIKSAIKGLKKMFGKKGRKKSQAWAKKKALGGKFTSKGKPKSKRGRRKKSGLNKAQKAVGKVLHHTKKWIKTPKKAFKDDMFLAKHKKVNPKKVRKGKYKTIFGNKRKVVGYKGKNPYIKKTRAGQAAGVAFSVPGFAAMEAGLGERTTVDGDKRGLARRTSRGLLEGLAFKAVPGVAIAGMLGSELNKVRKQKEKLDRPQGAALAAGKALGASFT